MSSFTTPLIVERLDNSDLYMLVERFSFWTNSWPELNRRKLDYGNDGECIINVPASYCTDFASIPRWLWPVFPKDHPHYAKAAVLHDYLLDYAIGDKAWADSVFLEGMLVLGCPMWKARLFYRFVRLFGRGNY